MAASLADPSPARVFGQRSRTPVELGLQVANAHPDPFREIGGNPPRVVVPGVLGRIPGGEDGGRKAPRVAASVEHDGAQVVGCEDTDRVVAIRRAATMRRIAAGAAADPVSLPPNTRTVPMNEISSSTRP